MDKLKAEFEQFLADNNINGVVGAKVGKSIMVTGGISAELIDKFCSASKAKHTSPMQTEHGLTFFIY